jgi:3-oxoacyl-[acyl-carrier-protein] synthase-3
MTRAYISGTGGFVPERIVTNEDLIAQYGIETDNEWIVKRTGIQSRHFAEEGVGTADLALPACQEAIAEAGIEPADLDLIIFATLSPDYAFPGSGVLLQEKLGLVQGDSKKFVPALDVRNQCSGFLYSLSTATSMVEAGRYKHILVVGAEVHSAALDLSTRGRTVACLFGDGAGAVVVSATQDPGRGMRTWNLGADGRYADILCQKVWDMSRRPFVQTDDEGNAMIPADELYAYMDGSTVFRHAITRMTQSLKQSLEADSGNIEDIDLFFFHQANLRINQMVAKQLELDADKLVHNITRYGNTTAATIPLLINEAVKTGRLKPGMRVAMVAFGSGFTWGSAVMDW